jgi:hypothetical protein
MDSREREIDDVTKYLVHWHTWAPLYARGEAWIDAPDENAARREAMRIVAVAASISMDHVQAEVLFAIRDKPGEAPTSGTIRESVQYPLR